MIVTLGADIDVGIVLGREIFTRAEREIIRRNQGLAKLIRDDGTGQDVGPHLGLMRIMANGTGDPDIGVVRNRDAGILAFDQGQPRRTRVTAPARTDARIHVFNDREVPARFPIVESIIVKTVVASAADLARQFLSRAFG